ncbi:alginate lyase family protein [Mariniflexile gromovii]|uniref:Alginate lyase family protein n=1 Tax=Mariniflexile gromovii TaxID=362523 RepID=A0ABS4BWI4_9FLAO|nr:alginate lyase family protein [Mariniflexile gromovii]MBP0904420.1 alginate lyase family protein [Mariniflexile gromovii]
MIHLRKLNWILAICILWSINGFSFSAIEIDTTVLIKVKQKIHDGSSSERTRSAYKSLIATANKLLDIKNPTVMDKTLVPPSGNKHDYLSISRYWWPDPEKPNGLPWMRKDGETNPETQTDAVDRKRLSVMSQGVKNLCFAYYFSGDERYAKKAASMLKTWFLDEATRMNPHLAFAQSVPGNSKGRSSGILDGRSISSVVPDAIAILSKSPHWTKNDTTNINKWLTEYLTWLTDSELGITENNQDNNHASWYKYQVAALALHLGNHSLAKATVEAGQESLDKQLDFEGKQIHELERTRSFFYSCYNLEALTHIASIGDKVGMDMWNYQSKDGKSLMLAFNYLAPVINGATWQYTEINGVDISDLIAPLARFANHTKSDEVSNLLKKSISILVEQEKTTGKKNDELEELSLTTTLDL